MNVRVLTNRHFNFLANILFLLLILFSNKINAADDVANNRLNITVTSGIDNTLLTNQSVVIYQRLASGARKGIRTAATDDKARLSLDLPGLGIDSTYELRTLPKHGNRAIYSAEITAPGNFAFKVGNSRVKLINGQTNAIISSHKISAYRHNADGPNTWFASANTDASGLADFQLPNLTDGQRYIFQAESLFDGKTKRSNLISSPGSSVFTIGNKLLNVTVTSGIDNTLLTNQSVVIYQRLTSGARKGIRAVTTDDKARLSLDLPGLGIDSTYELRTLPKHGNRAIYSAEITAPGNFAFKVGNSRVKLINGQTNAIISSHKISAYRHNADGPNTWFASANTDASGLADFQLPNLTDGQRYIFQAESLFDGKTKRSNLISSPGSSVFTIGNKLLNVTVTSGIDNTLLTNQSVVIYQRLTSGARKGIRAVTTDDKARLSLDLPGLGIDSTYELRTLPKHGNRAIYSAEITAPGNFAFKVGNSRVKLINGQTNAIISSHKISAYRHNADGPNTWFASANTDASGLADFQLPNLTDGQRYIFQAESLFDGKTKRSNLISSPGSSVFTIGNKLLNVVLIDALNNNPLPNIEVTAYIRMPDNSLKWSQKKTSNSFGQIDFDLDGLGSGTKYVLSSRPFGAKILSKDIIETGTFKIQAGAITATLLRKDNNSTLKGHQLHLFEKVSPSNFKWRATSKSNQKGKVRFDPSGLGFGKTFVILGKNFFGNNQSYYSQWITHKGQLKFIVDPNDPHKLDEEAPKFNQFYPANKAILADKGFALKMQITDNNTVKKVEIRIIDPIKGTTSGQAILSNNEWGFSVSADMISKNQIITIEAEASDQSGNKSNASYQYSIISDTEKPTLTIKSHQNGVQINEKGFLLTGTTTDNTGYIKLLATVTDPVKGVVVDHKEIEIGKNHNWALVTKNLSRGQDITITLEAIDSAGNTTNKNLMLSVMTEGSSMIQLINRITFGATPELLRELRAHGANSFIEQQLQPELIDDSEFEQQLTTLLAKEASSIRKLQYSQVAHAISSKRQLLEVMTQFWENHFNTDLTKVKSVTYEKQEHNNFRQHALGNFRDLLQISATSPAMLIYLDNAGSHKDEPNENYARELLELHTLGVDNSYTSEDIIEVARVFTGWRIKNHSFYFDTWRHDDNEKTVLGLDIPSNLGIAGGNMVLDLLSEHEGTADFICTKLLHTFVSDTPTTIATNQCAADFIRYINDDNQIALVLEKILKSSTFSNSLNFHSKVKNPLEFIAGLYRQLPISVNHSKTRAYLSEMGMPLFYSPLPTGWPEKSSDWVNSNQLIQRWKVTNNTVFNSPTKWKNHIKKPSKFLIDSGLETTDGILGYLFEILLSHNYSELEWNEALSILTRDQSEKFDIYNPNADEKIRQLIALILQYPTYQLQ